MHRLAENYKAISLIRPGAYTTTQTGTGVDVGPGYENDALAIVNFGTVSGTTPTCDVTIQTSDAVGGTYTTVATITQVTASNKLACVGFNLSGNNSGSVAQRFVRAVATIGGTTPSFGLSVELLVKAEIAKVDLNSATPA